MKLKMMSILLNYHLLLVLVLVLVLVHPVTLTTNKLGSYKKFKKSSNKLKVNI